MQLFHQLILSVLDIRGQATLVRADSTPKKTARDSKYLFRECYIYFARNHLGVSHMAALWNLMLSVAFSQKGNKYVDYEHHQEMALEQHENTNAWTIFGK